MLFAWASCAQIADLAGDMEYYNRADGLAQIHVFDIEEDSLGFMYFATMYGFSRFDGFNFENYRQVEGDSQSLSGNFVTSILIDKKQHVWVSTRTGLNLFDPVTEKVKRFLHKDDDDQSPGHNFIDGLAEDSNGLIYYTHKRGVDSYDPSTGVFRHYYHPKFNIQRHIGDIAIDRANRIWAASINGLYRVDVEDEKLDFFPMDSIPDASYAKILDVKVTDDNEIYVVGRFGIAQFHPETGKYEIKSGMNIVQAAISLWQNSDSTFYICGGQQGLNLYDFKADSVIFQRAYDPADPRGLMSSTIYAIYVDLRENIWLGLFNGLNRISAHSPRYDFIRFGKGVQNLENSILLVEDDHNGNLWVNTMRGLRYRKRGESSFGDVVYALFKTNPYLAVLSIASTNTSTYFHIQDIGLHELDESSGFIRPYVTPGLFDNKRVKLHTDVLDPNWIYVASATGLCHWNPATQDTIWLRPTMLTDGAKNNKTKFLAQRDSTLFFINSNQLWSYHVGNETIERIELPLENSNETIRQMVSDDAELILRTNASILRYNISLDRWVERRALPTDQGINSMEVDNRGTLWISGGVSIFAIEAGQDAVRTYRVPQGFTMVPAARTTTGDVAFATLEGVIYINPSTFYQDKTHPNVILTGVDVFDTPMTFNTAPNYVKEINVSYEDRSITIHFAALHFLHEENIVYYYRLADMDNQWRSNATSRSVSYAKLPHGEHIFEVKAKTEDGLESGITRLKITVETPFQKSLLFYLLIVAGVLTFITWLYVSRRRIRNERKRKELAEKAAEHKSMFLAHMSHEIRTPLNAIMGLNQLLLGSELSEKNRVYATSIASSCDNLLMIVNDILDQSKIEHGEYVIDNKEFEFVKLINQLDALFRLQAEKKNLELDISIADDIPPNIIGDPVRLFQVLTNLLGNAIKFTSVGRVELDVRLKEQDKDHVKLEFLIKDTGIGIAADKIDEIFKSFAQVNEMEFAGNQGTGLGLSIVKDIVSKMHGDISVTSEHGSGTTFVVDLPFEVGQGMDERQVQKSLEVSTKALSLLLAEDTMLNQLLVRDIISTYFPNATLDVVTNGQMAVEYSDKNSYHIILMDVKMPVLDGISATQRIRQSPDTEASLKIIGLTANAIPQQVMRCLDAGMDDVITKPFKVVDLVELLNKLTPDETE